MYESTRLLKFYMVPSFLYCVYNNLAFVNLLKFDPTTYYLLLQFRVVITGLIFQVSASAAPTYCTTIYRFFPSDYVQVVFKKLLTAVQWISLCLLTVGCIVNRLDFGHIFSHNDAHIVGAALPPSGVFRLDPFMLLILLQAVCSCLAGVYNEYILKNQGADVNIYVQNAYMYVDSIVANVVFMYNAFGWMTAASSASDEEASVIDQTASVWTPTVMLVMLNNACIGIVTSFFLKYLNSILKTFASALELVFTAVLCYLLFGIPITFSTVVSIAIVSAAIYLYTCAPVKNANHRISEGKRRQRREHIGDAATLTLLGNDEIEEEEEKEMDNNRTVAAVV